jgi:hypothetical protein
MRAEQNRTELGQYDRFERVTLEDFADLPSPRLSHSWESSGFPKMRDIRIWLYEVRGVLS